MRVDGPAGSAPSLALWRPEGVTVALGLSQEPGREMEVEACRRDGVGLIRRQSGGGAVLLYPGVLCWEAWATFEQVGSGEGDSGIRQCYAFCSRPVIAGLKRLGLDTFRAGICDLSVNRDGGSETRKIAGTAQLRRRRQVLVHGSLLVDADLERLGTYLKFPSDQPDYREGRSHRDFCATVVECLGRPDLCEEVATAIREAAAGMGWNIEAPPAGLSPEAARLERDKYLSDDWNWSRIRPKNEG